MLLEHIDDGKEKWQSHLVRIKDEDFTCVEAGVYSGDPFDIEGYGETKEEAFKDFKAKFKYLMDKWKEFERKLDDNKIPIN